MLSVVERRMLAATEGHAAALRALAAAAAVDDVQAAARGLGLGRGDYFQRPERAAPTDLVQTDDRSLKKVLVVFVSLGQEAREIAGLAGSRFLPGILTFDGHVVSSDDDSTEEELCGLAFFRALASFARRVMAVVLNVVQQLAALYSTLEESYKATFERVRLRTAFETLAELLKVLISLDVALRGNAAIAAASLGDGQELDAGSGGLVDLDWLMRGGCFAECVSMDFEVLPGGHKRVNVRGNPIVLREFQRSVATTLAEIHKKKRSAEESEEGRGADVVGLLGLYALHRRLAPAGEKPDARLYRALWALQKAVSTASFSAARTTWASDVSILAGPVARLGGSSGQAHWFVADFLLEHAPLATAARKLDPKPDQVLSLRREICAERAAGFVAEADSLTAATRAWLARASFGGRPSDDGAALLEALRLARAHSQLVATFLAADAPIAKSAIGALLAAVDSLKSLEHAAGQHPDDRSSGLRGLGCALLAHLEPLRTKLERRRSVDAAVGACDAIQAIVVQSDRYSSSRVRVVRLCLDVALNDATSSPGLDARCGSLVTRLGNLVDFDAGMRRACDCSFLFWSRELLEPILSCLWETGEWLRLPTVIAAAAGDVAPTLNRALLDQWKDYVLAALNRAVVIPACHAVETDLRLAAHHSQQDNKHNLSQLLRLPPLKGGFHVKRAVEEYLSRTFYDLVAVTIHDWPVYAQMRRLARERFGLRLADDLLPSGSLQDAGLDVLRIMQNIDVFAARFAYNMNQQNFVERQPDRSSKHLRSISIRSISASLGQHGLGVLDTAANYSYQFLAAKFEALNKLLFDDYVKSLLSRERRHFAGDRSGSGYSFDRALSLSVELKSLGREAGPLGHFRLLLTEMGNALGYVRMVRSAGAEQCAEGNRFVARDAAQLARSVAAEDNFAQTTTRKAGAALNSVLETLSFNQRDYLTVLVQAFSKGVQGEHHLDNFFAVIPCLCVAWVEASLQAKDRLLKQQQQQQQQQKEDVYYTDDGFAVGVSYVLAILGQEAEFDSLHWFESLEEKLNADASDANAKVNAKVTQVQQGKLQREAHALERRKKKKSFFFSSPRLDDDEDDEDEEDREAVEALEEELLALRAAARRIYGSRRDYDLLLFAITGARVFFTRKNMDDGDDDGSNSSSER